MRIAHDLKLQKACFVVDVILGETCETSIYNNAYHFPCGTCMIKLKTNAMRFVFFFMRPAQESSKVTNQALPTCDDPR